MCINIDRKTPTNGLGMVFFPGVELGGLPILLHTHIDRPHRSTAWREAEDSWLEHGTRCGRCVRPAAILQKKWSINGKEPSCLVSFVEIVAVRTRLCVMSQSTMEID